MVSENCRALFINISQTERPLTIRCGNHEQGLLNIKCEKNQIGISDTSDLELQGVQERQEWGRKAEFILGSFLKSFSKFINHSDWLNCSF